MNCLKAILFSLLVCSSLIAQRTPRIFYSDLESGPARGGQNDQGAIISLYGAGFGNARDQAFVSIGGVPAGAYLLWSDKKIAFQLGHAARSGDILVNLSRTAVSNGIPFTVRHGSIYFVSPVGRDSNNGSFASPRRSVAKTMQRMAPGDIVYALDGVAETALEDYNASLVIASAGQPSLPKALIAYPGARVQIGATAGPEFGIRTPSISGGPFSNWILAGFVLRGANQALDLRSVAGWRIISNDISCPSGDGPAACVEVANSRHIQFLGNTIHDTGSMRASKLYHSLYFTTDSNHIEVGWNTIANNRSCRGIQFHSSPDGSGSGLNQYDLIVHDNVIHGQACDGINFATINPSQGPVVAYNNLIYDVGLGPDPPDGSSNYACISSPGFTNAGPKGTGVTEWFNNTLYSCGARGGRDSGALHAGNDSPAVRLCNNIVYQRPGQNYFELEGRADLFSGSGNLWFGLGPGPDLLSGNINADPKFQDLAHANFRISFSSPAAHAAKKAEIETDLAGFPRPRLTKSSLGAYEPQ